MIKATRNGIKGIFSDTDWKSGQPQRYGWQEDGKEGKTLPKEIIQFIERRKAPQITDQVDTAQDEMDKLSKDEPIIQVDKKTKKNNNPKQKVRGAGKHKPRRVEKA